MIAVGSLATGYGGLDLAAERVLGGHTAWVADNDPGAAKILAARFPGVPNLSDVTAVDWTRVEPIDVLTAGYPCQPFSHAGKRAGADDPRNLWPHVLRAVRELRPRLVLLENVAGHLSLGFGRVLGDLAEVGYDARWTCLRAADVGAPHGRLRVFICAADTGLGRSPRRADVRAGEPDAGRRSRGAPADAGSGPLARTRADRNGLRVAAQRGALAPTDAAVEHERLIAAGDRRGEPEASPRNGHRPAPDPTGDGWDEGRPEPARLVGGPDAAQRGAVVADADGGNPGSQLGGASPTMGGGRAWQPRDEPGRPSVQWGVYAAAIARWERTLGRPAPAPTEPGRNGPRLSPRFVEWLMGLDPGWVTDVPGLARNAQLKALGNGVVPQQAEAALRWLLDVRENSA